MVLLNLKDMETFVVSRFIQGNELFPGKIIIDDNSVKLITPGFFNSIERKVPFKHISSVNVKCPFIGYSTITIECTGQSPIIVEGFTSSEVKKIQKLIFDNI